MPSPSLTRPDGIVAPAEGNVDCPPLRVSSYSTFYTMKKRAPCGREDGMMRLRSLFAVVAMLLGIAISTSGPAASPDWPKSLTLGTASPGGLYYVYCEALARILTEELR